MRLSCEVEVVNRLLASHNLKKASRSCHAQVSIGRKPVAGQSAGHESRLMLMVCTAKDRNGVKYMIKENVCQVFARFVNDGKATIRFKEPAQDLCFSKADPVILKSFLSLVRAAAQGADLKRVTLSTLAPASCKNVEKPKTDLTVTSRKEYPITSRFPSSLELLRINSCGMKRVDPRILHLSKLHTLDLSQNSLTSLPDNWGKIACMTNLILANNQLTTLQAGLWTSSLCHTLVSLDVRANQIASLPLQLCELKQLQYLKLDDNGLEAVPPTIGKLSRLKELSLSRNNVKTLPASFAQLRLENLDVSDNPLDLGESRVTGAEQLTFPTLMECTARFIRKHRLQYTEEDLFPQLFHYLGAARRCWCGNYCFSCSARYITHVHTRQLVACFTSSPGVTTLPIEGFLCSLHCYARFQRNPRAYWRT